MNNECIFCELNFTIVQAKRKQVHNAQHDDFNLVCIIILINIWIIFGCNHNKTFNRIFNILGFIASVHSNQNRENSYVFIVQRKTVQEYVIFGFDLNLFTC